MFDCPCCISKPLSARVRLAVAFANPLDGKAPFPITNSKLLWDALVWNLGAAAHPPVVPPGVHWQREGTFEDMTITPSIDASAARHWHGFITNGEIRP